MGCCIILTNMNLERQKSDDKRTFGDKIAQAVAIKTKGELVNMYYNLAVDAKFEPLANVYMEQAYIGVNELQETTRPSKADKLNHLMESAMKCGKSSKFERALENRKKRQEYKRIGKGLKRMFNDKCSDHRRDTMLSSHIEKMKLLQEEERKTGSSSSGSEDELGSTRHIPAPHIRQRKKTVLPHKKTVRDAVVVAKLNNLPTVV